MSAVHSDPGRYGHVFGHAVLTIDLDAMDCVVRAPVHPGRPAMRQMHLHSLDEVQGAYQTQISHRAIDPVSGDIARALQHAAKVLRAAEEGRLK